MGGAWDYSRSGRRLRAVGFFGLAVSFFRVAVSIFGVAVSIFGVAVSIFGVAVSFFRVAVSIFGVAVSFFGVAVSIFGVAVSFFGVAVSFFGVAVSFFGLAVSFFRVAVSFFGLAVSFFRVAAAEGAGVPFARIATAAPQWCLRALLNDRRRRSGSMVADAARRSAGRTGSGERCIGRSRSSLRRRSDGCCESKRCGPHRARCWRCQLGGCC